MKQNSFLEILREYFYEIYRNFVNEELVPQFWSSFGSKQSNDSICFHSLLFNAFNQVYLSSIQWINNEIIELSFDGINGFEEFRKFQNKMKDLLRSILLAEIPISFNQYLLRTYSLAFSVNQFNKKKNNSSHDSIDMTEMNDKCKGCQQTNQCFCRSIGSDFLRFNRQLSELGLIEVLSGDVITSVMHSCIEKHIYQSCKGINDFINNLLKP
jgi:hypothetical protein